MFGSTRLEHASGTKPSFRQAPYTGTPRASLWREAWRRLVPAAAALLLALATGACSYRLGSLFGTETDGAKPDPTSSISASAVPPPAATPLHEGDLALAKAAATEALTRGGKDVSVPWENPATGARGSVTPLASAYTQDGFVCRDFLASYVRGSAESWLQGEGCHIRQGRWEVRNLRAWKR